MATIESVVPVAGDGLRVSDIVSRVEYLLNDESNARWTLPELYLWINDACTAILELKPGARSVTADISLQAGAYQTLEEDEGFLFLLDITRNKKSDGTIKTPITACERKLLDYQQPGWYDLTQTEKIYHYCYDERTPRVFYVYPPAVDGTLVEAVVSERPGEVDDVDDVLDMPEQYIEPIVNYVCHRCVIKDAEEGDPGNSPLYYNAFLQNLGISVKKEAAATPNRNAL